MRRFFTIVNTDFFSYLDLPSLHFSCWPPHFPHCTPSFRTTVESTMQQIGGHQRYPLFFSPCAHAVSNAVSPAPNLLSSFICPSFSLAYEQTAQCTKSA
ncbi:unnamed protein product [Periconia digitata]|uniref:Uncharacterized protein n=1 Tax=Periconia digitata TaxID=1303443 RepID=A0A9W4XPY1_9PLEO|nr:unnamed protein product [Periconia digitata]